ncbi:MAG: LamG domain-containing protein [Saprospiraceae bacterium]|nr:LamG domain-containing protein [Saprospiraceae bacterium]
MKYFLAGLLFWTFSFATAQVMLPAYQGVISKPVANVNSIITSGLVLNLDASNNSSYPGSGVSYFTCGTNCISADITKSDSMTFSAWAKSSNFSASTMLFNTGAYGVGPDLLFYQNTIYWNIYDNTASPFTFSPAANISNWHNYTVVNDATSNAKLYIDGVFKASAAYRSNTATTTLSIGGGGTNTNKWVGEIANFQAYNRVLTASEVLQNFNSLKGGFGY